jgi:hypothetical protein
MPHTPLHPALASLLIERESIIADHAWRDRDSSDHLAALIRVSEAINEWTSIHLSTIDPRLQHYLQNASYGKALAHLQSGGTAPHHA